MNDSEAVSLLSGAVSIPSVSGAEAGLANWLAVRLGPLTDRSGTDAAGNFIATLGDGPIRLYFLGHIDTVPGDIPVRLEGGTLWGRGSVDAKGSFCSHIAGALRAFAEHPSLRSRLSVTLIGAVGEETPGSAGARHAVRTLPPPDLLVIGEPSGWQSLTIGYKGRRHLNIAVSCPAAHSAGQAPSAADSLLAACNAMSAAAAGMVPDHSPFSTVQLSVTGLASSSDGLEQTAEATVSLRLPPGVSCAAAAETLGQAAMSAAQPACLRIRMSEGVDAVLGQRDSVLSRVFRQAIRQRGGRPSFKVKTGTSDMNVVAPGWPAPVLAYGPGDSALDHAPDERLETAEYLASVAVTAEAVRLLGNT